MSSQLDSLLFLEPAKSNLETQSRKMNYPEN